MKGVIIAAGYGTRFLPATKTVPKEMFPLIDKPAISFIVEEFIDSGIEDILIISSRRKKSLEDYFDREVELESVFTKENSQKKLEKIKPLKANICFIRQQEMRGTGDALLLAQDFASGSQICVAYPDDIVFSDIPLTRQLMNACTSTEDTVLGVMNVADNEIDRYGIVDTNDNGRVSKLVEKPAIGSVKSNLAVIGRYILSTEIFPLLIEEKKKNPSGEFFQIDPINKLASMGKVKSHAFSGIRLDVGDPLGYLKAIVDYGLMREDLKDSFFSYLKKVVNK